MTIERTTLNDGSICVVERTDLVSPLLPDGAMDFTLVAHEVDDVIVWMQAYPANEADEVERVIADMALDPVSYVNPAEIVVLDAPVEIESPLEAGWTHPGVPDGPPDFTPRLVVDRDESGVAVSALGISPAGRPFAVEWNDTATLYDQLHDLGFDGKTIEEAYEASRVTILGIDRFLDISPPSGNGPVNVPHPLIDGQARIQAIEAARGEEE